MTADPCSQRPDVDDSAALSVAVDVRSRGRVPTCVICGASPACWPDADCRECQDAAIVRRVEAEARVVAGRDSHREPPPDVPADEPLVIVDSPTPEPTISAARISAAIARVGRRYAGACDHLPFVFGIETAATVALAARVVAVRNAIDSGERITAAERLHQLATWLHAACETIETEDRHAADLWIDLGTMIAETELICGLAAAAETRDVSDDADEVDEVHVEAEELEADNVQPAA